MYFVSDDIAPYSGQFRVLSPTGNPVGTISIDEGAAFPPSVDYNYVYGADK